MITVLIVKANEEIIKYFYPRAKFTDSTEHTCTFRISEKSMLKLIANVENAGYNRFALMSY